MISRFLRGEMQDLVKNYPGIEALNFGTGDTSYIAFRSCVTSTRKLLGSTDSH